jgi:hypothetical protein
MNKEIANEGRRPVDAKVVGNIWSSAVGFASYSTPIKNGGPHAIGNGEERKNDWSD